MKFISANQKDSLAITMYIVTVAMNIGKLEKAHYLQKQHFGEPGKACL